MLGAHAGLPGTFTWLKQRDHIMHAPPIDRQQIIDEEHLRLVSIGYYISGGLHIAFSSLFIFHFVFLIIITSNPDMFPPEAAGTGASPDAFFHIFAWFVGVAILLGWTFGGLTIYAGRCVKTRSKRVFSLVMAVLNALVIPVGTIIGISALMVLSRASVKQLYEQPSSETP